MLMITTLNCMMYIQSELFGWSSSSVPKIASLNPIQNIELEPSNYFVCINSSQELNTSKTRRNFWCHCIWKQWKQMEKRIGTLFNNIMLGISMLKYLILQCFWVWCCWLVSDASIFFAMMHFYFKTGEDEAISPWSDPPEQTLGTNSGQGFHCTFAVSKMCAFGVFKTRERCLLHWRAWATLKEFKEPLILCSQYLQQCFPWFDRRLCNLVLTVVGVGMAKLRKYFTL